MANAERPSPIRIIYRNRIWFPGDLSHGRFCTWEREISLLAGRFLLVPVVFFRNHIVLLGDGGICGDEQGKIVGSHGWFEFNSVASHGLYGLRFCREGSDQVCHRVWMLTNRNLDPWFDESLRPVECAE
jgi:hypothetical protein